MGNTKEAAVTEVFKYYIDIIYAISNGDADRSLYRFISSKCLHIKIQFSLYIMPNMLKQSLCKGLLSSVPVVVAPVHVQGTLGLALFVAQFTEKHFAHILMDISHMDI